MLILWAYLSEIKANVQQKSLFSRVCSQRIPNVSRFSLTQNKIFKTLLVAFLLMARMLKFQKNLKILEMLVDIQKNKQKGKAKDQKMHKIL